MICNLLIVRNSNVWIIWHVEIIIIPRKKPKTQTNEDRERDLTIKIDRMKLLHEKIKLQSNNEELTFEEDQEPPIQRNKEEEL